MIRALLSGALLAASLPGAAEEAPAIEIGSPFPLVKLPVVGNEDTFDSLEAYRGRKVMLHLFASW